MRNLKAARPFGPAAALESCSQRAAETLHRPDAVCVNNVSKRYLSRMAAVHAVDDVSLTVGAGEFVSIVGPSGCGKSTLLDMIAGLTSTTEGTIEVLGKRVTGPVTELGIVFQQHLLLPWRTVLQNVMLQIEVRDRKKRDYVDRAHELLERVGIAEFANRFPDELSGGMNQRAAICRALIYDPDLLIMDEPFGALDAMTRDQMGLDFHNLSRKEGKSVLFVTHSISEAIFLSNKVIIMSARPGHVVATIPLELGPERHLNVREEPEFTRYARQIRELFEIDGRLAPELTRMKWLANHLRNLLQNATVILTLIAIACVWQAVVRIYDIPDFLVPAPTDVWNSIVHNAMPLLFHSRVTLFETLAGFGLSIAIGVPLAVLIVCSTVIERILYPILVASQAVPKVALAPILLVGLGYGLAPKIVVALLIAFFPVVVNTVSGLSSVNRDTLKLMRSMGASQLHIFIKVRFPHAVPSMMAGFKVAIALAVVGAVVGEFVGSRNGLGYLMLAAAGNFDTSLVFACVVVLTLLGITLFYLIELGERFLGRWNRLAANARPDEPIGAFGM